MRNSAKGIRNPTNDWNPESRFHWQRIHNPERGIQNPRLSQFPYMGWYQFLSLYIKGRCWQDSLLLGNPIGINANPITLIDLAFLKLIVCVNYRVFSLYNMAAEEEKRHIGKRWDLGSSLRIGRLVMLLFGKYQRSLITYCFASIHSLHWVKTNSPLGGL